MAILVCEDNKMVAATISAILGREGYKTELAYDGKKALDLLDKNEYLLILVDIHLPYQSGLELIKYIRSDMNKKTPVIVISNFSDPKIIDQAMELGANDYIVKPIDPVYLIKQIKSFEKNS